MKGNKLIRRDLKRLQDDREVALREIRAAENTVRDARDKVKEIERGIESRDRLEKQLDAAQQEQKELLRNLKESEAQLAYLEKDIEKISSLSLQSQNTWVSKQEEAQMLVNQARRSLDRLESLNRQIDEYQGNQDDSLDHLKEEKERQEIKLENLKQRQKAVELKMKELEKRIADRKGSERELNDQLRYRALKKQIAECQRELSSLEGQHIDLERSSYERQMKALKMKQEKIIDKRGGLHGEIRQMQVQLDRYESDLRTDYEDIENRYHEQFVHLKMSELALQDLEIYSKALEQ
ncbi:hypothetical protein BX666DRAFT_1229966 [Dichotomocladium elegans]|nr:hypothetical protein BX666DRAFT_1229966 [Dichotomocladium elegans]